LSGGPFAGAASVVSAPGAVLECLTVEDSPDIGVLGEVGPLVVRTSTFRRNRVALQGVDVVLEDTTVEDNVLTIEAPLFDDVSDGSLDLGIVDLTGDLAITRASFRGNTAESQARVLRWLAEGAGDGDPTFTAEDVVFACNEVGWTLLYAGHPVFTSQVSLQGATFSENTTQMSTAYLHRARPALTDVRFAANQGALWGSTLHLALPATAVGEAGAVLDRVTLADNSHAGVDGASALLATGASATEIAATGLTVTRNRGCDAAVELAPDVVLDCTGCDFGAGAEDNAPFDAIRDRQLTAELGSDFSW
jgi:hypothetical protein